MLGLESLRVDLLDLLVCSCCVLCTSVGSRGLSLLRGYCAGTSSALYLYPTSMSPVLAAPGGACCRGSRYSRSVSVRVHARGGSGLGVSPD